MKALAVGLVLLAAPLAAATPPEISFEPDAVVARGISSQGPGRLVQRGPGDLAPVHQRRPPPCDRHGRGRRRHGPAGAGPGGAAALHLVRGGSGDRRDRRGRSGGLPPPGDGPAGQTRSRPRSTGSTWSAASPISLLVRPGVGAWQLRVGDGGASDEDGEPDGTLRAALSSLTPVKEGGPPPPERFSPRDVLLVIDPERMESAAVRIGAGQ